MESDLTSLEQPKKLMSSAERVGLALLFVFSFAFFLYFTFPFGVLKEAITATINRSSSMNVRIGTLTPNFPLGVDAGDIIVTKNNSSKALRISRATVEVGLLSLLLGRLRLDVTMQDKSKGEIYAQLRFSLWSVLTGSVSLPNYIEVESTKYPVDGAFDFALSLVDFGPNYQQFLGSYLEKLSFLGLLNGSMELDLNPSQPTTSSGFIDLSLANGSFTLEDPSLKIDPQVFSRFAVKAKMEKGALKLDPVTGLTSQDLTLTANGGIALKQDINTSQIDMEVSYKMEGSLQREIGVILDGFIGATNGEAKFQFSGPLSKYKPANL